MRLIDADAIPYTMLYKEDWMRAVGEEALGAWKSDIDNMPTIEPKTGRWIPLRKEGCYKCSECLAASRVDNAGIPRLYWNYCPRCGERMEG